MEFSNKYYDEVRNFVSKFVKTHKNFEYYELMDAVESKFHFDDMTDEELNHCIQDAWGNEVDSSIYPYGVLGENKYQHDASRYVRLFNNSNYQNKLLAIALTKIKEPLAVRNVIKEINVKEAKKLFDKFPSLKEKLPTKIREKIYPSKLTLIKPLVLYHLMSKQAQERLLHDLETNALPSYLLMRKYPLLKKPIILYKLLSKENQQRFKNAAKRILPINWLLGRK